MINPTQLAASHGRACAVSDSGLQCWGANGRFELPATIQNDKNLGQIFINHNTTCVLKKNNLNCWGGEYSMFKKLPEKLKNVTQFSMSSFVACSVDDHGIRCWKEWGVCDRFDLTPPTYLKNPRMISAGNCKACAIDDNGVHCWGAPSFDIDVPKDLKNPYFISAGYGNGACALTDEGLRCWGDIQYYMPKDLKNPTQVVVSSTNACALTDEGVRCWGYNPEINNVPSDL